MSWISDKLWEHVKRDKSRLKRPRVTVAFES